MKNVMSVVLTISIVCFCTGVVIMVCSADLPVGNKLAILGMLGAFFVFTYNTWFKP